MGIHPEAITPPVQPKVLPKPEMSLWFRILAMVAILIMEAAVLVGGYHEIRLRQIASATRITVTIGLPTTKERVLAASTLSLALKEYGFIHSDNELDPNEGLCEIQLGPRGEPLEAHYYPPGSGKMYKIECETDLSPDSVVSFPAVLAKMIWICNALDAERWDQTTPPKQEGSKLTA